MVYVLLANGFEEIEALTPVDLLRRAGAEVALVGVGSETVTGSHGIPVKTDMSAEAVLEKLSAGEKIEMLVLPGGMPGAKNLDESPVVDAILKCAVKADAYTAAICAAPMIFGKRGMLQGKKAVCYPGFEEYLRGAAVQDCGCVRDGKIITGQAMGAAVEFSLALVGALKGEGAAEELRTAILYR